MSQKNPEEFEAEAHREFRMVRHSITPDNDNDDYVRALPELEATIFWTMHLDSEVKNGGFHQWLGNPTGAFTFETVAALERIGAHDTARLVRRAQELFPDGRPPIDYVERHAIMDTFGDEQDSLLYGLNSAYSDGEGDQKSPGSIFEILMNYVDSYRSRDVPNKEDAARKI